MRTAPLLKINWWRGSSRGESISCDELDLESCIACAPLLFVTNWRCRARGISLLINSHWQKTLQRPASVYSHQVETDSETKTLGHFLIRELQPWAEDGDFKSINSWGGEKSAAEIAGGRVRVFLSIINDYNTEHQSPADFQLVLSCPSCWSRYFCNKKIIKVKWETHRNTMTGVR